ncbi:unannotated protein [freshwater metagenome]|uniref:Unannotated protein n=1 Tax=freshwater metagenome TaxID=449393 RepID=A0A6J6HU85_9ZZZZ
MADVPAAPGTNEIETDPSPGVAVNDVGAADNTRGVTRASVDSAPFPAAFTARNLIDCCVPLERPGTVTGDDVSTGFSAFQAPVPTRYS